MLYIIHRSALLMNFDVSKKRLGQKKGEHFFSFFSSSCEKAESLGAVEKLSRRSTPTDKSFFVCAE